MKAKTFVLGVLLCCMLSVISKAQDNKPVFSAGADFYSNYIFRGTKLSTGPAIQPNVKMTSGGFTLGVWGSFDANGYTEVDPYLNYVFPFGLSLGLTDYYSPSLKLFDVSDTAGSHALEFNAGFTAGGFAFSANYIFQEAGGIGSRGSDYYLQAGYNFEKFNITIGAGDGWHTSTGDFGVCHIGIGTSKEIKISDSFAIPVTGQVIMNPQREQLFVVVGFSL